MMLQQQEKEGEEVECEEREREMLQLQTADKGSFSKAEENSDYEGESGQH